VKPMVVTSCVRALVIDTARGGQVPRYPDALRQQGISGCVLARFVVDEQGLADTTTFRVIRFSRIEFAHAVRAALPGMRFTPAQINGRKVRQVVQQPYNFSIAPADRTIRAGPAMATVVQGPPPPRPPPPPIPAPKPALCP
jgi:TonB family protein